MRIQTWQPGSLYRRHDTRFHPDGHITKACTNMITLTLTVRSGSRIMATGAAIKPHAVVQIIISPTLLRFDERQRT